MAEAGGMTMPEDEENAIGVEPGQTKELTFTFAEAGRDPRGLSRRRSLRGRHEGRGHDRVTMPRFAALSAMVAVGLVIRRDLAVRAIRWLDRRGGITSRRGEEAYAAATGLFAGVHRRVAVDAAAVGARSIVDIGAGPGDLLRELRRLDPAALAGRGRPVRADASDRGHERDRRDRWPG